MLYLKKDSMVVFSDSHYRNDAVEKLERFLKWMKEKEGFDGRLYINIESIPFVQLNSEAQKMCAFNYGVKLDYDLNKWRAAEREQVETIVSEPFNNDVYGNSVPSEEAFNNSNYMTTFKFNVDDEVITSDGDAAKILNIRNVDPNNGNQYLVQSHCIHWLNKDRWIDEEELVRVPDTGTFLKEYIKNARRTECDYMQPILRVADKIDIIHGMIGLCTEVGELQDRLKRHIFYGKELDYVNIEEELGDIFWYIAIICKDKIDLMKVMEKNIAKLRARFPDKFTEKHAHMENRNLDAETKVLES